MIRSQSTHLENLEPRSLIWQRNIDELVQSAGPENSRVDDVRSICRSDDKDIFLTVHPVHFSEDLLLRASVSSENVISRYMEFPLVMYIVTTSVILCQHSFDQNPELNDQITPYKSFRLRHEY